MKVGVISDIHDNIWKLDVALPRLQETEVLICCGDLCSPFIVDRLGRGFSGPIHVVFGNNDGDRYRITLRAMQYPQIALHGDFAELELGGRKFAVHHFDDVGRALAKGGGYDVVCFGHNHRFELTREGATLIINPGEIMGGLSEDQRATFVIYDSDAHSARRVNLGEGRAKQQ